MAIRSDAFGKTKLTGPDAVRFMEQFFLDKKPNEKARASYARGRSRLAGLKKPDAVRG